MDQCDGRVAKGYADKRPKLGVVAAWRHRYAHVRAVD